VMRWGIVSTYQASVFASLAVPAIDSLPTVDHPDAMISLPEAMVNVRPMGREGEPLVTIDQFSGIADQLLQAGRAAHYQHAGASVRA
jgi:hypothetical protein